VDELLSKLQALQVSINSIIKYSRADTRNRRVSWPSVYDRQSWHNCWSVCLRWVSERTKASTGHKSMPPPLCQPSLLSQKLGNKRALIPRCIVAKWKVMKGLLFNFGSAKKERRPPMYIPTNLIHVLLWRLASINLPSKLHPSIAAAMFRRLLD
jgi:hypothetical protein